MNPTKWAIIGAIVIVIAMAFIADRGKSFAPDPTPTQSPANVAVADTAAPEPTAAPTPKPDMHAAREVDQHYWKQVIVTEILANAALHVAQANLHESDVVSASGNLKEAAKYSSAAHHFASVDVPRGWNDVSAQLSEVTDEFSAGFTTMRKAIDTGAVSDMSDALSHSQAANDKLVIATHLARVHYVAMGGKWSDISDGSDEANAMNGLVDATR